MAPCSHRSQVDDDDHLDDLMASETVKIVAGSPSIQGFPQPLQRHNVGRSPHGGLKLLRHVPNAVSFLNHFALKLLMHLRRRPVQPRAVLHPLQYREKPGCPSPVANHQPPTPLAHSQLQTHTAP